MKKQPKIIIERGPAGQIGILRDLRQIQLSVPDKDFFINKLRNPKKKDSGKKGGGLFSGLPFKSTKVKVPSDINQSIEKVKAFHSSFVAQDGSAEIARASGKDLMSISAMNDFRAEIKAAVAANETDFRWLALEAIIKFIDLKNSGIVREKQLVQQDCLRKIGQALHEDGGLSMFHATWFLTVYRDYLSGYKMFREGEVTNIAQEGGQKASNILKKLQRRQMEIPVYLNMIDEKSIDVNLLLRYSRDEKVKRSRHGHKGCTRQEIRSLFQDSEKSSNVADRTGRALEINIIMAYAMVFAKIPMLFEVVESIKSAIPANSTTSKLYRQKIEISQKLALLEIVRFVCRHDSSKDGDKKLFQLVKSTYNFCADVISEHNLGKAIPDSAIYTYPIIKQATLLIVYRKILTQDRERYKDMLLETAKKFDPIKQGVKSSDQTLRKIAKFADEYQLKLEMIEYEMRKSDPDKK